MSLARVLSRTQLGLEAPLIQVELHVGRGLPGFTIVGLPAPVVRESRERVRAALLNSGYEFPLGRITVNLAPVELEKQGGRFDLPIALSVLMASGQIPPARRAFECYGELGLAGALRPVSGLFLAALHARRARHALIVPADNACEVALSAHREAYTARTLREAVSLLHVPGEPLSQDCVQTREQLESTQPSLTEVIGQWQAKRALVVAAAGGHSMLMIGPPGSGKSMLAARLPGLLPPMSQDDAMEVAAIASVAGLSLEAFRWNTPPFRAPHHSCSAHAIVGGGSGIRPGEISLAHRGVLFLDELPEFDRRVLESLREPLETGTIALARARSRIELPAQFQLIAAMNPCPCGYQNDERHPCRCTRARVLRYRQRISGPLLDRIDICIQVPRLSDGELTGSASKAGPDYQMNTVRACVSAARSRRQACSGAISARLSRAQLQRCCTLPRDSQQLLERGCKQLGLSGRGVQRVLALGRTIADLAASDVIEATHLAEAIQLRRYCASDTM
jgi:magnesium chelatase family protein